MRVLICTLLVLALGCDTTVQSPIDVDDSSTPVEESIVAAKWQNDNANPRINRGETSWANSWTDPKNNLRATHTTVPLGGETDCGLQEPGEPLEYQDVGIFDPDDFFSSWIHEVKKGDIFIIVRDKSQPGDCFGDALVAQGWGTFVNVDNDLFGATGEDNNTNSWGFRGHGNLTAPDGSSVMYNGHLRLTYNPDRPVPFRTQSVLVNVN